MAKIQIRQDRIKKLEIINKLGIDPYPFFKEKRQTIKEAVFSFKEKKNTALAGRIRALRLHGGSLFLDLEDETGKIQAFLNRKKIGAEI